MEQRFTGRTVVVTGASSGIGDGIARRFAAEGANLVLAARRKDRLEALAAEIGTHRALPVTTDVTRQDEVDTLARWIEVSYGRLDVLVNNAGGHYDHAAAASTSDLASARDALDTNLFGAWRLSSAMLPLMRKHGYGRIVNISSGCATATSGSNCVAYRTSKAALNAYTRTLAAELAGSGIVVNAVCPGWVATELGGPGGRPVERGAAGIVWAASLPVPAPTGRFFRDGEIIPW